MLIDRNSKLLRANGKEVGVEDVKENMFFIQNELKNNIHVKLDNHKYTGYLYTITTANKEYKIFSGTHILTSQGYLSIEKIYSFNEKLDLMLLITRNSDYGIVSTYFASNRVFAVERELVENYDCYKVSNTQLVVDSLICVDNS